MTTTNKKQLHDFRVQYLSHTAKAVKVRYEDEEYWLPLGQIEMGQGDPEEMNRGDEFEVTVPDWLAVEKGMI